MSTYTTTMSQPISFKPLPRTPTSAPLVAPERSKWPTLPDSPHPSFANSRRPFSTFPRPRAKLDSPHIPTTPRLNSSQIPTTPRSPPSHIVVLPTTPRTPSHHTLSPPQPSPNQLPATPRSPPSHILLLPSPPSSPPSNLAVQEKRHGFLFPPLILNVDFEESTTTSNADDIFTPISPSLQEITEPLVSYIATENSSDPMMEAADVPISSVVDDTIASVKLDRGYSEQIPSALKERREPKNKLAHSPSLRLLRTWRSRASSGASEGQKGWI